jgi:S-adenosyl-L-methionine hydrolase (adenosine-forming)
MNLMSAAPLITLLTDFGADSPYVGAMKGAILSLNPAARIVDITHSVPHQDVRRGAWTWEEVAPHYPPGTIHIGVIDPGVGTSRRIVAAVIDGSTFICPDNGLLGRLVLRSKPSTIVALEAKEYWSPQVSHTFHGRDIMAPVAARLSLGLDVAQLGPPVDRLCEISWPEVVAMPGKIEGTIRSIDSFGNLISDIPADKLADVPTDPDRVRICCDEHETQGVFKTYGEQPAMTLVALVGSSGYLELAIVEENASIMLGIRAGTKIVVEWT